MNENNKNLSIKMFLHFIILNKKLKSLIKALIINNYQAQL